MIIKDYYDARKEKLKTYFGDGPTIQAILLSLKEIKPEETENDKNRKKNFIHSHLLLLSSLIKEHVKDSNSDNTKKENQAKTIFDMYKDIFSLDEVKRASEVYNKHRNGLLKANYVKDMSDSDLEECNWFLRLKLCLADAHEDLKNIIDIANIQEMKFIYTNRPLIYWNDKLDALINKTGRVSVCIEKTDHGKVYRKSLDEQALKDLDAYNENVLSAVVIKKAKIKTYEPDLKKDLAQDSKGFKLIQNEDKKQHKTEHKILYSQTPKQLNLSSDAEKERQKIAHLWMFGNVIKRQKLSKLTANEDFKNNHGMLTILLRIINILKLLDMRNTKRLIGKDMEEKIANLNEECSNLYNHVGRNNIGDLVMQIATHTRKPYAGSLGYTAEIQALEDVINKELNINNITKSNEAINNKTTWLSRMHL